MFTDRKSQKEVAGVVERFGAYGATGFSLLLQGDPLVYTIFDAPTTNIYPLGLTQSGDSVQFLAHASGMVSRRDFTNLTVLARIGTPI